MSKLDKVMNEEVNNHFFPFLWMHGEDKHTIKEYLEKISGTGMSSICIESRPYENFLQNQWWEDLAFIIEQCKILGMTIWILDDKHFPTGYAAGEVKNNYPHLQKQFLAVNSLDFIGPKQDAEIILDWLTVERPNIMNVGTESAKLNQNCDVNLSNIICICAAKKTAFNQIDENTITNLKWNTGESTLFWDVPDGDWSVFAIFKTTNGGEQATQGYLNPLVKESTNILIDTVYESHFNHFADEFGKTIRGFFSDEPRFGNTKGPDAIIGRKEMPIPWCDNLENKLAKKLGISKEEMIRKLLLLFMGNTDTAQEIQYQYMQLVSQLFSDNFSKVIGGWCEDHNVEYIGHVIEDNNAHARLGYGAGHFYRSMAGQHMAGLDIVLHQLVPGQNKGLFKSYTSTGWDGEFFTYGLAKLGSSLGQLDQLKKGRTMSELYGAYGWSEGIRLMKWLTDHMLVNGVNYFVPHAFTMKDFPDSDCPPHFYAHGNNLQFPYLKKLIKYSNKVSDLLTGGQYKSSVGILYHAEAEWSGKSMLFQKPARLLSENQISFNILSIDMIINQAFIKRDQIVINDMAFSTLIIPFAEKLPYKLLEKIIFINQAGVNIIFLEDFPSASCENIDSKQLLKKISGQCNVCALNKLIDCLDYTIDRLQISNYSPLLRYYHYTHDNEDIFMLFNESMNEKVETDVKFQTNKSLVIYNPTDNQLIYPKISQEGYEISLDKGETVIFCSNFVDTHFIKETHNWVNYQKLNDQPWLLDINEGLGSPNQKKWYFDELPKLTKMKEFSNFSGELTYQTSFTTFEDNLMLCISDVSEIVTVYLNDKKVDTKFSYPYKFELREFLKYGENDLKISVINSLGRFMKDYLSQYLYLEPVGIVGDIILLSEQ